MKFIEACARRPVSVLMAACGVLLFGVVAFFRLKIELLPSLRVPVVRVITEYPGIPAEEVEQLVTVPLENSLSSVPGLKGMEAVTKEEISAVSLRFGWKADMRTLAAAVREKIDSAYPYLPGGVRRPLVYTEDLNDDTVLTLAVFPREGKTLGDISILVRKELTARLARAAGVSRVRTEGTEELEILVEAEGRKLAAAGLSPEKAAGILAASIFDRPVGSVVEGGREYLVKAAAGTAASGTVSIESIRDLPLRSGPGGGVLRISDVAEVRLFPKEGGAFFQADGREGIGVYIGKQPDAGSLNTARAVLKEIEAARIHFERDFVIEVADDPTEEISASLRALLFAILCGTAAAFIVLILAFRQARAPLIVTAAIPLCIASVFLFMFFASMTLNIMSLSGLALGTGMIVDTGIVTLENLLRRSPHSPGEIAAAAAETASSTFASTITTVLIFLPVVFIPGVLGALFSELALTVSFLLVSSFVLSLTLTPALYALLLPRDVSGGGSSAVRRLYRRYLFTAFRRPWIPLLIFLLLAAGGVLSFAALPKRVMPRRDPDRLLLTVFLPPGTPVPEASRESAVLSRGLLAVPGVSRVLLGAGAGRRSLRDRGEAGRNSWTLRFVLFTEKASSAPAGREIEKFLRDIPGLRYSLSIPQDTTSRILGAEEGFRYRLSGETRASLSLRAEALLRRLRDGGLIEGPGPDSTAGLKRILFRTDDPALALQGISPRGILGALESAVRGTVPTRVPCGEEDLDIRLRLRRDETDRAEKLSRILVPGLGGYIEAGRLGSFEEETSAAELFRSDRKPSLALGLLPAPGRERDLERVLIEGREGILISRSGLTESGKDAGAVFLLAAVLMYLLLGAQFESFRIPFLLLLSFPLSVTGSFLLLLLFGYSLNLNSFLGILILLGTTINTPILLTGAYGGGGTLRIIRASEARLKPLCAAAGTTLAAVLPVLLNTGGENVLQSNTAAALAGGLSTGTAAVLLVYPVLYRLLTRRRKAIHP
jgi:HAE1 family hydrophobic/amphiphilic exporter-1